MPPGPVLVELAHEDEGFVSLRRVDERNKDEDFVFATPLPHFRGSRIIEAPRGRPLRFRITAMGRWVLRVKPVAAARRIEGVLHRYGPEALLRTGRRVDVRIDFSGTVEVDDGYISLHRYGVEGCTTLPSDARLLPSSHGRPGQCRSRTAPWRCATTRRARGH